MVSRFGGRHSRRRDGIAFIPFFPVVLMIVALFFSMTVLVIVVRDDSRYFRTERHKKYTLYIGLNDGETGKQVMSADGAKKALFDVASRYVDGYTVYEAEGFWKEGGVMLTEKTLVCVIVGAKKEAVKHIMDDLLKELRQNSILVEEGRVFSTFYGGNRDEK